MAKMSRRQLRQMIMENMNEDMLGDIRQGLGLDPTYADKVVERMPRGHLFNETIEDYLLKALGPMGSIGPEDRLAMVGQKVREVLADIIDEILKETTQS